MGNTQDNFEKKKKGESKQSFQFIYKKKNTRKENKQNSCSFTMSTTKVNNVHDYL